RRKFVVLAHGSIFSKVGASSKPGAIHNACQHGIEDRSLCLVAREPACRQIRSQARGDIGNVASRHIS
ncbi:hypothetical protein, partial [Burkholderia multivorans]|uniref:hypothetical protein n=1 Tax=Burkholderia multivorans TaxID=87883 RepID=UPI00286FDFFF